ncbi:hypothetical protein [Streptomyces sp. NPDC005012]|uniref:hypothetical protein n=1 Tax=Streptomyces sp. NPDC005012 TaxID=3154558 RepID=UPI0033B8C383
MSAWPENKRSRTWTDSGTYSQVQFTNCFAENGTSKSVVVKLWATDYLPDVGLDSKTFTNCFNGAGYVSNGEWTDIPSGEHSLQFEPTKIAQGGDCCLLNVSRVYVDTTQAD